MNIDELATNVARDIGAVRQRSCKRVDGVEYHFEQSELEQFANELIAEYEKTVNSEPVVLEYPDYHDEAMGCGLEDCGITDRYEAMRHGWDRAVERMFEQIPEGPLYERPDPRVAELEAENEQLRLQWAGCSQQLKDACDDLSKVEEACSKLTRQRDEAVQMLADWCDAVRDNGTGWDDWDEHYKDAAWRQSGIRELIDAARTTEGETE